MCRDKKKNRFCGQCERFSTQNLYRKHSGKDALFLPANLNARRERLAVRFWGEKRFCPDKKTIRFTLTPFYLRRSAAESEVTSPKRR